MPRGDGTGPVGAGPMTGRAAGVCAGYPTAGYTQPSGGRGWFSGFRGRGGGRRRRNWFHATGAAGMGRGRGFFGPGAAPAAVSELDVLRREAEYLQESLSSVKERIGQLETE